MLKNVSAGVSNFLYEFFGTFRALGQSASKSTFVVVECVVVIESHHALLTTSTSKKGLAAAFAAAFALPLFYRFVLLQMVGELTSAITK